MMYVLIKNAIFIFTLIIFLPLSINGNTVKYKNVFIEWKNVTGAFGYKVEVKYKDGDIFIRKIVKKSRVNLRLPEGDFLLRIGAMNRLKAVESFSDWQTVKIIIKNPPNPPEEIQFEKIKIGENNISIRLKWKPPTKMKGTVSYIVMKIIDGEYVKIAKTEDTGFVVQDLPGGELYKFIIFSVNKDGEESTSGSKITIDDAVLPIQISINPYFIWPLSRFGGLFHYGYGGLINIYLENIFIKNLNTGISTGSIYLKGKKTDSPDHYDAKQSLIIPICLNAQYSFQLLKDISMRPYLLIGYTMNNLEYYDDKKIKKKNFWDPLITGGISFLYKINPLIEVSFGCDYGLIFESNGILQYLGFNTGLGLRFM